MNRTNIRRRLISQRFEPSARVCHQLSGSIAQTKFSSPRQQDLRSAVHKRLWSSIYGNHVGAPFVQSKSQRCRHCCPTANAKALWRMALRGVPTKVDLHVCHITASAVEL